MNRAHIAAMLFLLLAVLPFLASCGQTDAAAPSSSAVALVNCRLIDGTGGAAVEQAAVVLEGGKIAYAGQKADAKIAEGARVIDLGGATVLPGFINAHVHRAYDEKNLQAWLRAGVTTVRDEAPMFAGDFLAQRDKLNQAMTNATIVSATPILTVPDGYGTASFTSAEEAKSAVQGYIDRGVDIVKLSIEDDLQGRTWAMPTAEELKALADTAHAGGRRVSAHISHVRNLQAALDIGVDDIAHMVVEPLSEETAAAIAQKGIYWVPTLELWSGVSEMHSLDWLDIAVDNLAVFRAAGGKVALGTDFAGYVCDFDTGFPITEVELMQRAGMSGMDVIVAGTANAARVCGIDAKTGTVEAGKDADLLIVRGNPLEDIRALLSVRMVVHKGEIIVGNKD